MLALVARVSVHLLHLHEDGCSAGSFWLLCGNYLMQEILAKNKIHILRTQLPKKYNAILNVFMLFLCWQSGGTHSVARVSGWRRWSSKLMQIRQGGFLHFAVCLNWKCFLTGFSHPESNSVKRSCSCCQTVKDTIWTVKTSGVLVVGGGTSSFYFLLLKLILFPSHLLFFLLLYRRKILRLYFPFRKNRNQWAKNSTCRHCLMKSYRRGEIKLQYKIFSLLLYSPSCWGDTEYCMYGQEEVEQPLSIAFPKALLVPSTGRPSAGPAELWISSPK